LGDDVTDTVVEQYEAAVIELLNTKAFFAKLIMSTKKDFKFTLPTCGVSIKSTGFTLHINPPFFNSLTHKERVAVLQHEVLHILHAHFLRFNNFQDKDRQLANVACDIAINQFIPNIPKVIKMQLPDGSVKEVEPATYERLLKEIPGLEPKMNAEYYFKKIKQEQEKNQDGNQGGNEEYMLTDSHDEWEKTDLTAEQEEKLIKKHVKALLDSCSDQERSCVDKTLIDELYKSDVNWKAQLRNFFANSEEMITIATRKKRNRRYGIVQPGIKTDPKLSLAVCVDTSGSISDEQLNTFFGEIARLYDENTMVLHIIEADMKVQNFYKYKKGMKIEASGRGGTAYGPAIEKAKKLGADSILYMGDFDCSDVPVNPRLPFLWVGVGSQKPPADFGRVIYLK